MAILDELITQIENPDLHARIATEVEKLAKQKKFAWCLKSTCRSVRRCGISR